MQFTREALLKHVSSRMGRMGGSMGIEIHTKREKLEFRYRASGKDLSTRANDSHNKNKMLAIIGRRNVVINRFTFPLRAI